MVTFYSTSLIQVDGLLRDGHTLVLSATYRPLSLSTSCLKALNLPHKPVSERQEPLIQRHFIN